MVLLPLICQSWNTDSVLTSGLFPLHESVKIWSACMFLVCHVHSLQSPVKHLFYTMTSVYVSLQSPIKHLFYNMSTSVCVIDVLCFIAGFNYDNG